MKRREDDIEEFIKEIDALENEIFEVTEKVFGLDNGIFQEQKLKFDQEQELEDLSKKKGGKKTSRKSVMPTPPVAPERPASLRSSHSSKLSDPISEPNYDLSPPTRNNTMRMSTPVNPLMESSRKDMDNSFDRSFEQKGRRSTVTSLGQTSRGMRKVPRLSNQEFDESFRQESEVNKNEISMTVSESGSEDGFDDDGEFMPERETLRTTNTKSRRKKQKKDPVAKETKNSTCAEKSCCVLF